MKQTIRYAAIALSSVGLSGVALADSSAVANGPGSMNYLDHSNYSSTSHNNYNSVGVQNSNSQSASSGDVSASSNTGVGSHGSYSGDWSGLSPSTWQTGGHNFNDWWNTMMEQLGHGGSWAGHNDSWTPEGDNWQNDWSNWNPDMWREHGSSYGNWFSHVLPYLNSHYSMWMNGWGGSGGNSSVGSLSSGEASNTNTTATMVELENGGGNQTASLGSLMPASIQAVANGPDSSNVIRSDSTYRSEHTNTNVVSVSNDNYQAASSGNVSASRNTSVGGLSSGDAHNANQTGTGVSIMN